jgi:hypothetical protein
MFTLTACGLMPRPRSPVDLGFLCSAAWGVHWASWLDRSWVVSGVYVLLSVGFIRPPGSLLGGNRTQLIYTCHAMLCGDDKKELLGVLGDPCSSFCLGVFMAALGSLRGGLGVNDLFV